MVAGEWVRADEVMRQPVPRGGRGDLILGTAGVGKQRAGSTVRGGGKDLLGDQIDRGTEHDHLGVAADSLDRNVFPDSAALRARKDLLRA